MKLGTRASQSCCLVAALAVCLGVGLWMQQRTATSALAQAREEIVWEKLERRAALIRSSGGAVPNKPHEQDAAGTSEGAPSTEEDLYLVLKSDRTWRVTSALTELGQRSPITSNLQLAWASAPSAPDEPSAALRGWFRAGNAEYLAVALPEASGEGYLLVGYPAGIVRSEAARLAGPLAASAWVTFLWTTVVLGVLAWVAVGWLSVRTGEGGSTALSHALQQSQNVLRTRDAVIFGLAKLADSRDADTGEHLERISAYCTTLATELRRHSKFASQVTHAFIRNIGISAALHDIGKVGIEDRILLKSTAFTTEERSRMQAHTLIGGQCLREIEQRLGSSNFLQMAREIALAHHERWDGSGYPYGLRGNEIPLSARIVAIADVYDALSTRRIYKPAYPHAECVAMMKAQSGGYFDPDMLDIWLAIERRFREIAAQYAAAAPYESSPAARHRTGGASFSHPDNELAGVEALAEFSKRS